MRRSTAYRPKADANDKSERKRAVVPAIRAAREAVRSAKRRDGLEVESSKRQRALDLAADAEEPFDVATQSITRAILREAPSRQQGLGFGKSRRNPGGPAWFLTAVRAGAIPYAMGEHGQYTALSPDWKRAITDADAPLGKLDRAKGARCDGDVFDVQSTLTAVSEAAALKWLKGTKRQGKRKARNPATWQHEAAHQAVQRALKSKSDADKTQAARLLSHASVARSSQRSVLPNPKKRIDLPTFPAGLAPGILWLMRYGKRGYSGRYQDKHTGEISGHVFSTFADASDYARRYGVEWRDVPMANPAKRKTAKRNAAALPVAQGLILNPANRIQTLLFEKNIWGAAAAAEWARGHGYLTGPVDRGTKTAQYLRIRQHDPRAYKPGSFRTIEIVPSIYAVVGTPR